jgi:hypothetical protein
MDTKNIIILFGLIILIIHLFLVGFIINGKPFSALFSSSYNIMPFIPMVVLSSYLIADLMEAYTENKNYAIGASVLMSMFGLVLLVNVFIEYIRYKRFNTKEFVEGLFYLIIGLVLCYLRYRNVNKGDEKDIE